MSVESIKGLSGYVFNIQRFSTHDGPGIRTTVFLKGCHLRCFWCQNPESQDLKPVLMVRKQKCVACARCVQVCPHKACNIINNQMVIDRARCAACGICVAVCLPKLRSV